MVKDDIKVELNQDFDDSFVVPLNRSGKFRQCLATFIVNISTIILGTVNGWLAPVQQQLMSDHPPVGRRLDYDEISWVGSITFMGGMCGILVWARAADLIGRKGAGYLIGLPFLISWTMLLTCEKYWLLILARFIAGFGGTGVLINTPLYVGEITSSNLRGPLGSSLILFINFGYLLSFLFGSVLNYFQFNLFCLSIPIIYLTLFMFLPETPQYLLLNHQVDEAKKSLLYFNGDNIASMDYEFKLLVASVSDSQGTKTRISDLWNKKSTLRALIIGLTLITGQQVIGINVLLTYTVAIFSRAGTSISPNISSVIVGFTMLVASAGSCCLINRLGRKYLLIFTYIGMASCIFALAICFLFDKTSWFIQSTYMPLVSFSLAIVFYSLGVGPVPYVLSSEIFPSSVRNLATSIIITWGIFGSFVTVKLFPAMVGVLGHFATFSIYAVCGVLLSLYCYLVVPETKNQSIKAVIELLESTPSNFPSKSRRYI